MILLTYFFTLLLSLLYGLNAKLSIVYGPKRKQRQ